MHDPRPGARLTRAERHYYRARAIGDEAHQMYLDVEDRWIKDHADELNEAGAGWKRLLRDQQRAEGHMRDAYRLWQRARKWERLWFMAKQQATRAYKEHRDMGFGG